jgi:hypothetical protein
MEGFSLRITLDDLMIMKLSRHLKLHGGRIQWLGRRGVDQLLNGALTANACRLSAAHESAHNLDNIERLVVIDFNDSELLQTIGSTSVDGIVDVSCMLIFTSRDTTSYVDVVRRRHTINC